MIKKDMIYAIVAVSILVVVSFISAVAVGLIDNPFAPNHFVGSWTRTDEPGTMIFYRPILARWGTGKIDGYTSFEYKYTDTKLIIRYQGGDLPIIIFEYSFSSDYQLLIISYAGHDLTLIKA